MSRTPALFAVFALVAAGGCDGGGLPDCGSGLAFSISKNELSASIPTVGVIEWSVTGGAPTTATIVYELKDAASAIVNRGGEAPVDLRKPNHRTLLLGLKQSSDYTFHVVATRDGRTCVSPEYALPTTGVFPNARPVTVSVTRAEKREPGFIVTSSGAFVPASAFIIDADGDVVWYVDAPPNPTRAQMDYEGDNLWMLSLNLDNVEGEMRYVSMDGEQEQRNVAGLDHAHHDFTVMPGGKIAALVWRDPGSIDPPSDLVIRSPDGTVASAFTIGSNLYRAETFHANALHYLPFDDSFTIADRNPSVLVKVSATGALQWQLGGVCDEAPAGDRCVPQDWRVVHGHHLLEDGTLLLFNNSYGAPSHVFELALDAAPGSFAATLVKDYAREGESTILGDVQRLPGGNTLVTYSTDARIVEVDARWEEVQTFSARVGYTSWRPTLYGPPARL
jgi:hypothetical protein